MSDTPLDRDGDVMRQRFGACLVRVARRAAERGGEGHVNVEALEKRVNLARDGVALDAVASRDDDAERAHRAARGRRGAALGSALVGAALPKRAAYASRSQ